MSAKPLTTVEPTIMDIDQILPLIGEFGKYQIILEIMFCIAIIPQSLQILIMYFTGINPGWMCVANSTLCTLNGTIYHGDTHYNYRCSIPRSEWQFSKPKDFSTVTQFDLHCDTESLIEWSTSVLFIGWAVGAVVLGWLADMFGRRKVLLPSTAAIMIFGLLSIWSPNIETFIVLRFFVGFVTPGTSVQLFIMCSELVGPRKRPFAGIILWLFFSVALIILGVKAYFVRKWKMLFIICTAPYFFVLIFFKFIPESIRWQYVHGKLEDVMNTLHNIARINKKEFPEVELAPLPKDNASSKKKTSPLDLFRTNKMAFSTLNQGFCWLVFGLAYYGVSLALNDLSPNMYRNFILASLVEFPAIFCAIDFCNRFGRKKTVVIPMFIGGAACIGVSLIPAGTSITRWNVLRVTLGLIGKFCIALSFDAVYTWSVELHPTTIRAEGMGLLQITSRIGAAAAPWIAKSLKDVHIVLPFSIMGGATFISAILLLFLEETKDAATRETIINEDNVSHEKGGPYPSEKDETKLINVVKNETNGNLATDV